MRRATKIIGASILVATGLGIYFLNKAKTTSQTGVKYLDDALVSGNGTVVFNPKVIADTLYEAMKSTGKSVGSTVGLSIGTDKEVIFDILAGISQAGFASVVKAFGLKPYNKTTGNQLFLIWQTPTKYGLKTWLKEELPTKDYLLLQKKYPNYL